MIFTNELWEGVERALPQGKSAELQASASIPLILCWAGTAGWIRAACLHAGKQGVGCVHLGVSGSGCASPGGWWQQDEDTVAVTQQWGLGGQRVWVEVRGSWAVLGISPAAGACHAFLYFQAPLCNPWLAASTSSLSKSFLGWFNIFPFCDRALLLLPYWQLWRLSVWICF